MRLALLAATLLGGCSLIAPFHTAPLSAGEGDSGEDDGGSGGDAPGSDVADVSDVAVDGEIADLPLPRPFTVVVKEMLFTREPLCDVDGDGSLDNAFDSLDATEAQLLATGLNQALQAEVEEGHRLLVRFSATAQGEVAVVLAEGLDIDCPPDQSDDFGGDGAFYVETPSVDACAEPIHVLGTVSTAGPFLVATDGVVPLPRLPLGRSPVLRADLEGVRVPRRLELCATLSIGELAAADGLAPRGDLNALQELVAGAEVMGQPPSEGLMPDVDVDGDGLESFVVVDGQIVECLDGDGTVVEGPSCWLDERLADAFSFAMTLTARKAVLVGPEPSWWEERRDACEAPELGRLWAPCAVVGRVCERGESRACNAGCGFSGRRECLWDCSGFSMCVPSDESPASHRSVESCEDIETHHDYSPFNLDGSPRDVPAAPGICDPLSGAIGLVDEFREIAGFRLVNPVVVDEGPVVVEASLRVARSTTDIPADGWAIVVFPLQAGAWLGPGGGGLGVNRYRPGYALEWRFWDNLVGEDWDVVTLRSSRGDVSEWSRVAPECLDQCRLWSEPSLDTEMEGEVVQRVRLLIQPDYWETPWNEMSVTAELVDGDEVVPMGIGCRCGGCPVQIQSGDVLHVGVVAATGDLDADVVVETFTVDAEGPCQ